MGDLPASRVSQVKPFLHTGVDYAGPFNVMMSRYRGCRTKLVSSLSTEAFLAASRRFVARRGRFQHLYSDCGSNFIGASKQLNNFIVKSAASEGITWHFNPPFAPHFGGLWEAGVKYIEAFLNSRPLTPFSNDPNDMTARTPGHFLTLEPLSVPPELDVTSLPVRQLDRWQMLQKMHQDFWRHWSALRREYLHTLHQRAKWHKSSGNLSPGTLVLIRNDLAPPLHWSIGRITEVHPGLDGIVRVVTVRTSNGTLNRPVVKLCPLPLSED
ncbi:uncharacterized protein LOC126745960 [Anthonomus grandis grandis]|uniref:uncharacterized protein LOC126745960 n=1 Tax=Anthonomus grandis grandis TaxID=2921223 RepID=UPI002166B7FE|nr:uncharacterized protein LOC126745960 [Anthonomus grandis grandis]